MKLKRLDSRMTGYGDFTHSVDLPKGDEFLNVRDWCIETWGNSVEVDLWKSNPAHRNPAWSWERNRDHYVCRIFFAGETEAAWFKLRWV